jgi:hypothetical protein
MALNVRAAALALGLMLGVAAAGHAGGLSYRQVCKDDYKKFCATARFNAVKCMRAHASDLSDACKAAWLAHEKAGAAASNAAEGQ